MRVLAAQVALGVMATACSPFYSPPVRGLHTGAPGLSTDRQVEVGLSAGGFLVPSVLVPHVSLGLRDGFRFEAGLNANVSSQSWLMGWAGARKTFEKHLGIALKLYSDLELGVGLGAGGQNGRSLIPWYELRARGVYGGFGVGLRIAYFGVFVRARMDAGEGERTGTSLWPSAIIGAEVRIAPHLVLGVAGGYLGLFTDSGDYNGWMYQAQLRYFFDVPT